MKKVRIVSVLGRGFTAVLVGLLISHCGRIGYQDVTVLSDERRLGNSDRDPSDDRPESDGSVETMSDADAADDEGPRADAGSTDEDGGASNAQDAAMPNTQDAAMPSTLDDGLVGYWSIDEGAGSTLNDRSGLGNHGTLTGAVTWSDSPRGSVLAFSDQQINYVSVASSASINSITQAVSVSAWVSTLGSGWEQAILSRQRGQGVDQQYSLQIFQTKVQFQLGATRIDYTPSSFPTAVWFHLAATYDGVTARLYMDGLEVSSAARAASLVADTTPVLIGSKQEGQNLWSALNGSLDSVRLYDRALTATEVAALAQ